MCKFHKLLLSKFLDGRVSPEERERVNQHLLICKECSQEIEKMRLLSQWVNRLPGMEVSPDYDLKFERRLAERLAEREVFSFSFILERLKAGIE
ncbi:MAG: zf-HC2 domain-containing protein, partial [Candidatus Omnitrophica bacterium]|nr:zf-HC2 domain-containing protein [Candidatus Omnitrophota bacterium]